MTQLKEAWDAPWGLDLSQNLTWLKNAWENKVQAFVQDPWHRKDHAWGAENLEVGVAQPSSLKVGSREEVRAWNHSGGYQPVRIARQALAWDDQPGEDQAVAGHGQASQQEQPGEDQPCEDQPGEDLLMGRQANVTLQRNSRISSAVAAGVSAGTPASCNKANLFESQGARACELRFQPGRPGFSAKQRYHQQERYLLHERP